MQQTFAGFLMNHKRVCQARAVVAYIDNVRKDTRGTIRARIDAALERGHIDAAYHETLHTYVDECHAAFLRCGKLLDMRDPRDWKPLGKGATMRETHIEPDNSGVVDFGFGRASLTYGYCRLRARGKYERIP